VTGRRRVPLDSGFSLIELLAAMAITVVLGGAVIGLVNGIRAVVVTQPELADLQQRLRAAALQVTGELVNAGAGLDRTPLAGPLATAIPAIVPYRRGALDDDGRAGVWFRRDAVSVVYVASTAGQAEVADAVDLGGRLLLAPRPNCGAAAPTALCGFRAGMRAILLEPRGAYDLVTVENVTAGTIEVSYAAPLASAYRSGRAVVAHAAVHTFELARDGTTGVPILSHYDGFATARPAVDHVVAIAFDYFGEADPPRLRPAADLTAPRGPWTTYGPPPPPIGVDDPETAWPAGENCVFQVAAGAHLSRLPPLGAPGELVPLPAAQLSDGPWCPDAAAARRFDADLLRIRRVRVRLRAEAASDALRGASGPLFMRAGTAARAAALIPDQEVVMDVVPRNYATRR
jgi:prepilin-type N-terminal cleavage/methylation domain-containing protein